MGSSTNCTVISVSPRPDTWVADLELDSGEIVTGAECGMVPRPGHPVPMPNVGDRAWARDRGLRGWRIERVISGGK
jgi:hypothetical protein